MRVSPKVRTATCAAVCLCVCITGAHAASAATADSPGTDPFRAAEAWAFPIEHSQDPGAPTSSQAPKPDPHEIVHVAGSTRTYTVGQLDAGSPDWFPQDHPPPPRIVSKGQKPASRCAECHLINGTGAPATASLAGLPKAYILEQVAAFRAGERGMGGPATAHDMFDEARALTPGDLQQAAAYFSATRFISRVRVVETATVPKMHWKYYVQVPDKGDAREPIGQRIIETPANFDDYQYLTGRTAYVAYVPPGSIARGALIAAVGEGSAASCESCHGAKLEGQTMPGIGVVPPLAGRSPTYIARELILFREGKRSNPAAPMRTEAAALTVPEMIDVAAYAASRKP